ncbi:MAG: DUF2721 domain-containing protein [Woeseiaceae bacterium]
MNDISSVDSIAQIIRTAVTPVFLLVGISGLLNTLFGRLGRVIDRKRTVDAGLKPAPDEQCEQSLRVESQRLQKRIRLVNWSIRCCVASAFVVCLVVVALFVGDFVSLSLTGTIASLFMLAMLLIIAGLTALLSEVSIATRQARNEPEDCSASS